MKKIKKKNKIKVTQERGITLIALVITIIILIILATVTLNVVLGEGGLIDRAQQAKELTEQAALEEQQGLNSLMSEFTNIMAEDQTPPEPPKVPETTQEAKPTPNEDGPKFENTTTITDDLDNPVTIPGGFHLDKDSGTKVEEGIVIEDDAGNQFVWIPVGSYETSSGIKTNNLSRRTFTAEGSTEVENDNAIYNVYGEGYSNDTVAYETIEAFKTSAINNKGYYIGRYEAGTKVRRISGSDLLTIPLVQENIYPYSFITRNQAVTQSAAMYSDSEFVTSELISSYAWDTALNFICQNSEYGYELATTGSSDFANLMTGTMTNTGEYSADCYSNIYDFLGNCHEWTTEYGKSNPCVGRGGNWEDRDYGASDRIAYMLNISTGDGSFRIQLYIK